MKSNHIPWVPGKDTLLTDPGFCVKKELEVIIPYRTGVQGLCPLRGTAVSVKTVNNAIRKAMRGDTYEYSEI